MQAEAPATVEKKEEDTVADHGDPELVMVKLMASLGPTWISFVTASPPPALIAQHGAQTTWNLLRFLLAGLLEALQDQAFLESEEFLEQMPYLCEQLRESGQDWIGTVMTAAQADLERQYGQEESFELLQTMCATVFDRIDDLGLQLPPQLAYRAPAPAPAEETAPEAAVAEQPQREESDRARMRGIGASIIQGR